MKPPSRGGCGAPRSAERVRLRQALADAVGLSPTEARAPGSSPKPNSAHQPHPNHWIPRPDRVLHGPASGLTAQIGDGPGLARRFGTRLRTISGLPDMAAGGQGAPLVPIYHHAVAAALD